MYIITSPESVLYSGQRMTLRDRGYTNDATDIPILLLPETCLSLSNAVAVAVEEPSRELQELQEL